MQITSSKKNFSDVNLVIFLLTDAVNLYLQPMFFGNNSSSHVITIDD